MTSKSDTAVCNTGSQLTSLLPRYISPSLCKEINTVCTDSDRPSSIVNLSRLQSGEAPSLLNCLVMVLPDFSFHCQIFLINSSRPISWRVSPSSASCLSTTICVAIPAWSVPGCHKVSSPFILW